MQLGQRPVNAIIMIIVIFAIALVQKIAFLVAARTASCRALMSTASPSKSGIFADDRLSQVKHYSILVQLEARI